jgi:hypothetical protein
MDSTTRYRRLSTGPAGRIREIAISLLMPHAEHLPTRTEVREAIADALPGDQYADARASIYEKLVTIAKAGVSGMDRVEARSVIDEWTLKLADQLEAEDRLLPVTDEEVDTAAALEAIDGFDPTNRPKTAAQRAAIQAADIESAKKVGA